MALEHEIFQKKNTTNTWLSTLHSILLENQTNLSTFTSINCAQIMLQGLCMTHPIC